MPVRRRALSSYLCGRVSVLCGRREPRWSGWATRRRFLFLWTSRRKTRTQSYRRTTRTLQKRETRGLLGDNKLRDFLNFIGHLSWVFCQWWPIVYPAGTEQCLSFNVMFYCLFCCAANCSFGKYCVMWHRVVGRPVRPTLWLSSLVDAGIQPQGFILDLTFVWHCV